MEQTVFPKAPYLNECAVKEVKSESFTNEKDERQIIGEYNINIPNSPDILMSRESPDGSSDSCATSPVNRPSIHNVGGSSLPSCNKLISEPRLLHSRDIGNITGARPKENFPQQERKDELFIKSHDSEHENRISPSLLEVHYEQEGLDTSSQKRQESQGVKVPISRYHSVTDSDQDSEDGTKKAHPQCLRRRRQPTLQQVSTLSVKSLVDSRGVLQNDSEQHDRKNNSGSDFKQSKSDDSVKKHDHKVSDPREVSQEAAKIGPSQMTDSARCTEGIPQISIPVPVSPCRETQGNIAASAPIHVKSNSAINKHRMKKKKTHGRSRSDGAQEVVNTLQLCHSNTDPSIENPIRSSTSNIPVPERKRFMEDGGHSITPAADNGFFPRPQPGQSLIEFLSSKEFHKQNAALDKENAHFNISEAVIAALTQMQFNAWHQKFSSSPGTVEESDEEIRNLQAQIQEKRRQKLSSSASSTVPFTASSEATTFGYGSPPNPESTTDASPNESPPSSHYNSESDLISDSEESDQEFQDLKETSIDMFSSMKDGEMPFDLTSAEKVAISLLKNFNEQRLPKASELEWLVSEEEAPQKLLPLPTSIAVSPEDGSAAGGSNTMHVTQLRGTSDWAPPRPQLILTLPTYTKRSVMMKTQDWRCAGCGMKVSEHLSRHFRFCNYLGRYFCTTCHSNQTAIIPARVIQKWDFKLYPVSNFSLELIESMKCDPLFNVSALNSGLYKKCRHLQQTRIYRLQLYYALPYINMCSRANNEKKLMNNRPQHWACDPHAYSLEDLISARNGFFVGEVKKITKLCINHIAKCQVCAGQGFICEICSEGEPIFPFQLDSTAICATCSACYHVGCFCPLRCPRCIRRETRRLPTEAS